MRLNVKLTQQPSTFKADFGEVHNISDGGFDRGYAEGYAEGLEAGSEINKGTCTITIVPASIANHEVCQETIESNGSVAYDVSRRYTKNPFTVTARCGSVFYMLVPYIKGAEVTDGELLAVASGAGLVYKTPSADNATAQITLTG